MFGEIKHRTRRQRNSGITVDDVAVHICYDLPEQSNRQGKCFATGGVRGMRFVVMRKATERHNRVCCERGKYLRYVLLNSEQNYRIRD